jgi:hypothetical protein
MTDVSSPQYVERLYDCIDYVPFLSSFKGLYSIFQKYVNSNPGEFFQVSLQRGGLGRDLALLMPFLGNVTVIAYDVVTAVKRLEVDTGSDTDSNESVAGSSREGSDWSSLAVTEQTYRENYEKNTGVIGRIGRAMCCWWCSA